jgi:hypothetical protein
MQLAVLGVGRYLVRCRTFLEYGGVSRLSATEACWELSTEGQTSSRDKGGITKPSCPAPLREVGGGVRATHILLRT